MILPLLLPSESTEDTTAFDVPSLFLHLLLFDTVIVPTVRLQDIAAVVRTVGLKPTMELLEADCLYVRSPLDQLATSGATQPDVCEMIYLWSNDPDKIRSTPSRWTSRTCAISHSAFPSVSKSMRPHAAHS